MTPMTMVLTILGAEFPVFVWLFAMACDTIILTTLIASRVVQ